MRSLQEFAVADANNIFVDADTLPSFFDTNLVEPSRVVKIFRNDPQANIRVFYYQYLKLCFEVTDCDYEQYIRKIEDIINDPNFAFVFDESEDTSVFNDLQFKQLIMEFFGLLGEGVASIETCLNTYPIIDTVFVYFFRSILILTNSTDSLDSYIDRMTLFNILTDHFNVQMDVHENCIRFPQSDIFVYEDRPDEVFMAYIDVEGEGAPQQPSKEYVSYEGSEEVIEPPIQLKAAEVKMHSPPQVQNLIAAKPPSSRSRKEGKTQIKESYVEGEFLDYTSNSPALHTFVKENKMKQSGSIDESSYAPKSNNYPQEKSLPKPSQFKPKQEPTAKIDPPQYVTTKSQYQSDYSNKSQNDKIITSNNNSNDILNSLLGKSQKQELSTVKSNEQMSYTNPTAWQPAVDPNFAKTTNGYTPTNSYSMQPSINPTNMVQMQQNTYGMQQNTYGMQPTQPIPNNSIQAGGFTQSNNFNNFNNVSSYSNSNVGMNYVNNSNTGSKPSSSFYNSGFDSKVQQKKPASYNPQVPSSIEVKKPGFYEPPATSPAPPIPTYAPPKSGKHPCGLNVSEEFTNSFTMKIMNEPHRSNVTGIRQRARNYRNSLKTFLK